MFEAEKETEREGQRDERDAKSARRTDQLIRGKSVNGLRDVREVCEQLIYEGRTNGSTCNGGLCAVISNKSQIARDPDWLELNAMAFKFLISSEPQRILSDDVGNTVSWMRRWTLS
jgi:hypothetical protein